MPLQWSPTWTALLYQGNTCNSWCSSTMFLIASQEKKSLCFQSSGSSHHSLSATIRSRWLQRTVFPRSAQLAGTVVLMHRCTLPFRRAVRPLRAHHHAVRRLPCGVDVVTVTTEDEVQILARMAGAARDSFDTFRGWRTAQYRSILKEIFYLMWSPSVDGGKQIIQNV